MVADGIGSGVYRFHAIDAAGFPDPGRSYALRVRKDSERDYWLEFRQTKASYPVSLADGAMVSWGPWGDFYNPTTAWGSNGGAQMLDMTPGSPDGKNDSILLPGRTWADEDAGLTVTVLGKGRTVPESLDVVVQRGPFHGNRVPVVRIESAGPTVAVGAAAMFRAVASDPDGDPVVYAWDFGNGAYGPNQAEVSRTWPTAGRYSVRCTVSDMKGGAASAVVPVTVGATAELVASGAVRGPSGEPLRGIRVSGSQTGSPTRMTESDSEGRYWLSGLIPGAVTVRAVDPLWSFTASSAMPVTLSGDVASLDFAAVRRPALEVSLRSGDCGEGGPAGVVRFTRRHMPLSGPLEFRIYAGGSAGLEDCDFLPAEVVDSGNLKFTIPSGQEFLDVRVQAVDDAEAEGPETVELHLLDGVGYVPQGLATATVTLGDNDSELPLVSLRVAGYTAAEGGEAAGIAVRRTGSVASALVVNLQWQGSAEEGRDFLVEPSPVVIPAGDASAVVRVRAIQDEESEGLEDAVVSVAPAANYLRSRTEGAAALVLRDDDLPMVSLTVPDASASEAGRDPGIILISRSGSTRQPLEVGYALGGSGMHGIDYAALSGSVTIPAGSASAAVTVVPVDDAMGELADTLVLHLVSAPGYGVGGVATGTVTISDDDLPRIEVVVQDGAVAENGDAGVFRLVARGSGNGHVAMKYALSGTAVAGVDYAALPGVINVPVGGAAELVVTPLQDTESED
ncbi:MAG: Calx-beta domain-containing protein, partial [Verrucomicrobiota bacterium]